MAAANNTAAASAAVAQPNQQPAQAAAPQAAAAATAAPGAADAKTAEKKFAGLHSFVIYDKKFTVDAKYLPKKPLGKGAYGVVCACVDQTTGRKVAIKKIPDAFEDLIDAKRILREIKLLRHFNHDNVIKLYDMIEPPEHGPFDDIYMVFELMDIDMSKSMQVNKNELTDEHFQYFIYQMLRGLKYIHSANVLHRDLKPSNLLLNSDCKLKICDFGLSRGVKKNVKEVDYELTEYVVTRWYRAPEVMCSSHEYDYKLDVWAVGCILAELVMGKPLFPGRDNIHQMQLIFQLLGTPSDDDMKRISSEKALDLLKKLPHCKKINFKEKFAKANPLAVDLIEKTLEFNPTKRMGVNDALKHPYLAKFRQPEQETDCKTPFDFEFEKVQMTKHRLREFIWEEVLAYRPAAKAKHERWLKNETERQRKAAQKVVGGSSAASSASPMKLG